MSQQINERDVAEVVEFLRKKNQYFKASLVTFLYNFFRLHVGIEPKLDHEKSDSNQVKKDV